MKGKFTSVILAVVLVVITVGTVFFGYSKASGKAAKSSVEGEQRYAWPLATCSTEDTITHIFATQFAKEVEKLSDGKMKINVYPQSTLGGDRELMESCKDGDIPFVVQSPAPQVSFMPQLCVFDTPCVFENIDDARKAIDNADFQKEIQKIYKGAGYDLLGIADQCFRVMTSAKPFTGIESFKGQKIRTMENPIHLKAWKSIGANPTPMAFSELFTAMQQGTVDGEENPIGIIYSNRFYEVQKYITLTQHVYTPYVVFMNPDKYDSLTDEQQEIIDKAMKEASAYQLEVSAKDEEEGLKEMEKYGCEVNTLTDDQKKEFQKLIEDADVFSLAKSSMEHPEYFDEIQKELTQYREEGK